MVDVLQGYAKLPDMGELLGLPTPGRNEITTSRVHSATRRLGDAGIAEMVTDYVDNRCSCSALASKYGISKSTVLRLLGVEGVQMRPVGKQGTPSGRSKDT